MLNDIKKKIIDNNFVNDIRINMNFNNDEYNELVSSLEKLANYMKNETIIDKELALYLYTTPQMIRNAYASFDKWENKPELALRLEDAWIELDSLVINCLS
ncbi:MULTISPECIES: hypothetical protein [Escherichia]|uniref:hypothetical protein n=1 Tax=Escherichia TaxID=561 RepID=UPI0001FB578B|nr:MULTISPECIES: hypothetical protein [Escherichia]EFC4196327.1 hypothetical protein [Escherichia coli]EFI4024494.1 hypothetical protein [Escherichia coli]EFL4510397.1 hypothetical protein [Escherichia fergusonii]EFL4513800.1 hypothetical protein [Escherichia fergusonii]EFN0218665.1 hypothetical protein [Escherichia fergusonii]